jgi:hypothetical protein
MSLPLCAVVTDTKTKRVKPSRGENSDVSFDDWMAVKAQEFQLVDSIHIPEEITDESNLVY